MRLLPSSRMPMILTRIVIPIKSVAARRKDTSPRTGRRPQSVKDSVLDLPLWIHALSDALVVS